MEGGDSAPQEPDTHTKLILPCAVEGPGQNLCCLSAYIFCATKWRSVKCVCGGGESVRERGSIHLRGVRVIS